MSYSYKIKLINYTPLSVINTVTSIPYQSEESDSLTEKVWNVGHRSIGRHGIITFEIDKVSQNFLRQVSRHPHISLMVKSSRYCDMSEEEIIRPLRVHPEDVSEYEEDMNHIKDIYKKWSVMYAHNKELSREISKMFLVLASTTDIILSGNYQAMYEFLQLRNCTRVEEEFRLIANKMTNILKREIPEIFKDLGCQSDERLYCIEHKPCGKHPTKEKVKKLLDKHL